MGFMNSLRFGDEEEHSEWSGRVLAESDGGWTARPPSFSHTPRSASRWRMANIARSDQNSLPASQARTSASASTREAPVRSLTIEIS